MSFRARVALLTTAGIALAVGLACVSAFLVVRGTIYGAVDETLRTISPPPDILLAPATVPLPNVAAAELARTGPFGVLRVVAADGSVLFSLPADAIPLPDDAVRRVLAGEAEVLRTVVVGGRPMRVRSAPIGQGGAVLEVARYVDDIEAGLDRTLQLMAAIGLLGVLLGAGIGLLVSQRALRPVEAFAAAAEHVAATDDLEGRLAVEGDDELARLATSFNRMLTRLAEARQAQRQLVADASHELRTPLAAVRTNIELLAVGLRLDAERAPVLAETVGQLEELTRLVGDLVDLARHGDHEPAFEVVRLDELVADAVRQARTFAPQVDFALDLAPVDLDGAPDRLRRAVVNLLDNAVKYGRGPVEVRVRAAGVTVRDHGPGVAPAELPKLFERFWRADTVRGAPGSGLGLAIVAQVAAGHGGTVSAVPAPDGGLWVTFTLPARSRPS